MTTEQNMLDALIQHQVYSYRASTKVVNELQSQFVTASNVLSNRLRELLDELTDAEKNALTLGKYTTETLKEVKTAFDEWYQVMAVTLPETFAVSAVALAVYESSYISKLYGEEIELDGTKVFNQSKKMPVVGGQLYDDVWRNLSESVRKKALYAVREGISQGLTTAQIVSEIQGQRVKQPSGKFEYIGGIVAQAKNEIEANVRTVRTHVGNIAMVETFDALGFDYVKDVATLDGRTSATCRVRDGVVQKVTEVTQRPPYHFNCLLADSHVLTVGGVSGASKRWFDGEIIIIKTAKDRELRCTPNHPILTSLGWVGAGFLNVGGDVVSDLASNWEGLSVSNHENTPPLIQDVVDSVFCSSEMFSMPVPVSTKDFHNDGEGSKVAIVASNSFLSGSFNTSIRKHFFKHNLVSRLPVIWILLNGNSSLNHGLNGNTSALGGSMGACSKFLNFIWSGFSHSSKLLLRPISCLNSMFFKNRCCSSNTDTNCIGHATNPNSRIKAFNHRLLSGVGFSKFVNNMLLRPISNFGLNKVSCNNIANSVNTKSSGYGDILLRKSISIHRANDFAGFLRGGTSYNDLVSSITDNVDDSGLINIDALGDIENGGSRVIGFDNIVDIKREFFSGHVYNLETDNGYYVANGIITHNCRTIQVGCEKDGKIDGKRPFVADTRSVKDIPKDERKDIIGQVDANTKYPEWFAKQDEVFQQEVLGKTKFDLYKDGAFPITKFTDPLGKPYTIAELRELDQKTFARLGL